MEPTGRSVGQRQLGNNEKRHFQLRLELSRLAEFSQWLNKGWRQPGGDVRRG